MSEGSGWVEIVLLALLAAFIGLRLVSVLGKRTGPERPAERPIGDAFRPSAELTAPQRREAERPVRGQLLLPPGTDRGLLPALEAVADVDPSFVPDRFLAGARTAYGMILQGFWSSDLSGLNGLVSDEVHHNLSAAVDARSGARLPNRLVSIDSAMLHDAHVVAQMVEVTVRFVARVATADAETETCDLWTFSRLAGSQDPAWVLIATDNEADSDQMPPDLLGDSADPTA